MVEVERVDIRTSANTIKLIGTLSQNTHCQDKNSVINPPYRGPITAPASAAPPANPIGIPLFDALNMSLIMAIDTGSKAPAPIACTILVAITHSIVFILSISRLSL